MVKSSTHRLQPHTTEYTAVHHWAERHCEDPGHCQHCGASDRKLCWANKSGNYLRDETDWIRFCYSCHAIYDRRPLDRSVCKRGHLMTPENTYYPPVGTERVCKLCLKESRYREGSGSPKYNKTAPKCGSGHTLEGNTHTITIGQHTILVCEQCENNLGKD